MNYYPQNSVYWDHYVRQHTHLHQCIHEHKLAVKGHDTLPIISIHTTMIANMIV